MIWLLDGCALASLLLNGHPFHPRMVAWIGTHSDDVATCAVTESTLLRLHMQMAVDRSSQAAWASLAVFKSNQRVAFFDDGFTYQRVNYRHIQGHKQVTDAWLAELARIKGVKLATLDAGLVATHPDVGFLIP